ncbi:MAG TPA: ATP synthase F1 subunit gamma [Solirubrobacteraceae bacterium]|nr:ATP synthase F1 subunit gamma [Solirubrobacteraceae bacterium]
MAQKEVKQRIGSVKNVQKITRAMEMVAAARLRKAEQRIAALRPYAGAIRRMTRQAAEAAQNVPNLPILQDREETKTVGIVIMTGDRGLAGAFNSQVIRAAIRGAQEHEAEGRTCVFFASGRRGVSSLNFRGREAQGAYTGHTDRPSYANAREIADDVIAAYVDGELDRVEVFFNHYESPLVQHVTREVLLPMQQATVAEAAAMQEDLERTPDDEETGHTALTEYEPDPGDILARLVPDYVEISLFRALLESTASEHGARMTAMRNASENAKELISDLTLQLNRERQAEITQEIMEVVAGAESV